MCKLENVKVGIRDLNFTAYRGKMLVRLTDGREIIVPVSFFPDIKQMSVKERLVLCKYLKLIKSFSFFLQNKSIDNRATHRQIG